MVINERINCIHVFREIHMPDFQSVKVKLCREAIKVVKTICGACVFFTFGVPHTPHIVEQRLGEFVKSFESHVDLFAILSIRSTGSGDGFVILN